MARRTPKRRPSPERMLEFVKMFNKLVVLDDELSAKLPEDEFELDFDPNGGIYVDGKSLGLNVKELRAALVPG